MRQTHVGWPLTWHVIINNLVMDGQYVAELATIGVTHLGTAPPLVVGIGHCVYAVFGVFAVHVVFVDVGDVALIFCWLGGGWSAGAGMETAVDVRDDDMWDRYHLSLSMWDVGVVIDDTVVWWWCRASSTTVAWPNMGTCYGLDDDGGSRRG